MTLPRAHGYASGPLTVSGVADFTDGTASLPSITNTGDLNTGFYFPAADTVGIATNGTLRVSVSTTAVSSSLNTIIGSTSVAPDGTLHVHTATAGTVTASSNADDLVVENSGDGGISILVPDASAARLVFGTPSDNFGAYLYWAHDPSQFVAGTQKVGASTILVGGDGVTNVTLSGAAGAELATFVRHVTMTNGDLTISAGDLVITTATTPASAGATGVAGTVAWDADYIYICTATNTWKRVAIAAW